ncbi:MAG: hypothetical protein ACLGGY_03850 [Gammaproteobacteria bacterium]
MSTWVQPLPIAADHPAYAGHFPGQPILPGVVLLDAALHALATQRGLAWDAVQLNAAKFLSPVRPGEALTLHASASPAGGIRFEIRCSDAQGSERSVASGNVVFPPAGPA